MGTGSRYASIPTKCMLQMPMPSATLPPASHAMRKRPYAALTRAESASAVYDARMAIRMENATSAAL